MIERIAALYQHLIQLPFPELGKSVGDFPLYDVMLAGFATQAAQGISIDKAVIPVPDTETIETVEKLRERPNLTEEERYFLEYFEVLETLRIALEQSNLAGS